MFDALPLADSVLVGWCVRLRTVIMLTVRGGDISARLGRVGEGGGWLRQLLFTGVPI